MAVDRNTIPQQTIEDLLEGLPRAQGSLADQMCERVPVDGTTGTIPVEPSSASLPREQPHGLIPEGAEAKPHDEELEDVDYHCMRAVGSATIPDGVADQVDSVTGTSTVQRLLMRCTNISNRSIDAELETALTSTSLNTEFDVTSAGSGNEWDDPANAKPLKDTDDALDEVPGANLMFIGRTDAKNLKENPDVVAEISNFSAGMASDSELAQLYTTKFASINDVIVGVTHFSNAANEGQSLDVEYDLADVTWLGHQRDLILVESGQPNTEQGRVVLRESDVLLYSRRIDILRPHQEMGTIFTNTTT